MELRAGFRFAPSDEALVTYLTEKVYGGGEARSDRVVLLECDMYGDKEPWNIWNDHGGLNLNINAGQDLFFFTKLKKVSANGSRNHKRRVGSGTWSGAYSREVAGGVAKKRHFSYENEGCSEHHLAWIMHEYSLDDRSADYVLCRLRRRIKKTINKKQSKSVSTQTKNLALVINDDQEIIKKQRLGVDSESDHHEDSSTKIFQNLEQQYLPTKTNLNSHDQQEKSYMQEQVDGALNNNNITRIQSFDDTRDFGEWFHTDSPKEFKETSWDDFIDVAKSSTTTLGALPDEKVLVDNLHVDAADDAIDFGFLFDSDEQDLKEITREEYINHAVAVNAAKSSSSTTYHHHHPVEAVEEHSGHHRRPVEAVEEHSGHHHHHVEAVEEHSGFGGTVNFVEIDDDDDHGINNVAKSSSTATTACQEDQDHGDQIIICEDDNDESSKLISKITEDDQELEKLLPAHQTNNNHGTAGADHDLSQLTIEEEDVDDEEYLSGKKSFAELLKDVPLYYEAHDHDDVFMDTVRSFGL